MFKRVLLFSVLLFTWFFTYSQSEVAIYNLVYKEYVERLKQPNLDYSKGVVLTLLRRPKYLPKLESKDFGRFKEKYDKLELSTFINFIEESQKDIQGEKIIISGAEVVILENESIPEWSNLIEAYPNWIFSIIEFSNIGFNEARNQALVYYGFDSGPGVGGGVYFVLEFNGKKWKFKEVIPSWAA